MRRPQTTRRILADLHLVASWTQTELEGVGPGYNEVDKSALRAEKWALRMLEWHRSKEEDE